MHKTHQVRTISDHFWPLRCRSSARQCTPLCREANFEVKIHQTPGSDLSDYFWKLRRQKARRSTSRSQNAQNWRVRSTFWRSDIFSRGSRSTRDLFIRAVPERGWGWLRFTEMILRDRCSSTKYDRRSSLDRWSRKNEKPIGTRLSGLHSTFHFGRKTRRIASFLTLSSAQILEVSLNCRDFDAVKYKNSGSLAE